MKTHSLSVSVIASTMGLVAGNAHAEPRAFYESSSRQGQANATNSQSRAAWEPSSRAHEDASALASTVPSTADEITRSAAVHEQYPAATRALELTVATGYSQAFGKVGNGHPQLNDVGQAGAGVQLGVGYRFLPQLTLGVYGSGAMFSRGDASDSSTNMYSASAGVQADWHFLPAGETLDPWIGLGTGWRGYWIHSDGSLAGQATSATTSLQGLQLAKLQVGVDYRVAPAIAISPVIGVDMSMFLSESPAGSTGYRNIESPQVNTFVFAGLLGRFDISTASPQSSSVAQR